MCSLAGGVSSLKEYLQKSIDLERADSKGLKALAFCWVNWKRAFSVICQFQEALSNLGMCENLLKAQETALRNNANYSFGSFVFHSSQILRLQF